MVKISVILPFFFIFFFFSQLNKLSMYLEALAIPENTNFDFLLFVKDMALPI
jgi:hypothetical protein